MSLIFPFKKFPIQRISKPKNPREIQISALTQGLEKGNHSLKSCRESAGGCAPTTIYQCDPSPMVPDKYFLPIPTQSFSLMGGTKCRCQGGPAPTRAADGHLSNRSMAIAMQPVPKG